MKEKVVGTDVKEKAAEKDVEERIEEEKSKLKEKLSGMRERAKEIQEALGQGKGRLKLEKPMLASDEPIEELIYDFTELTGMEYIDAMDADSKSQQSYKITYAQALNLFAAAAAKQTPLIDDRDIVTQIGVTDAVEAVQLATLFFQASARAGQMRIYKK